MASTTLLDLYGIASPAQIRMKNLVTKDTVVLDFINTFEGDLTSDMLYAKNGGVDDIAWTKPAKFMVKIGAEEVNTEVLTQMLAGNIIKTDVQLLKTETLTLSATKEATLTSTPLVGSLVVYNADRTVRYTVGANPASLTATEYSITGTTLKTGGAEGDVLILDYLMVDATKRKVVVNATSQSAFFELWVDFFKKMKATGETKLETLHIFRATPKKQIKLVFDLDKVTTFDMELTGLPNNQKDMFELIED